MNYLNFINISKTLSSEEKIQYIFDALNKNSNEYRKNVAYLLQRDPSPIVRHEAAYIFGELSNEDCSNYLIETITHDTNRFVIHEALLALSNRGNIENQHFIEGQLSNPDKDIVDTAKISLQRLIMKNEKISIQKENARECILNLQSQMEERIQSAFILMEEGSEKSINTLIEAYYKEPNPIVKHEIIFSLGESASILAAETLANGIMSETNDFVIHESLLALSTLGFATYCDLIREFTLHPSDEVAESAKIALERLKCISS
ncbi:MAG: HEAT repeat domain-containing protein [Candidatus Kariarchaeaceae archaeon]|jgi:deoxyhypusine monooxygenase